MSVPALVLTYHAVEQGPGPLCLDPDVFRRHLEVIAEAEATVVSLRRLTELTRDGGPDEPTVALTFDDGFASVTEHAAPLLRERGYPATVFCVAGHLGRLNDWKSEPRGGPRLPLADPDRLGELSRQGLSLGSHGMSHRPLARVGEAELEQEVLASRERLERETGAAVSWFAYPFGSVPAEAGRAVVARAYEGAVAGGNRQVEPRADRWALPRVDAHYLRRPRLLRRALLGHRGHLAIRRIGGRARRLARPDDRRS